MALEAIHAKAPQKRISPRKYNPAFFKLLFASLLILFLLKVTLSSVICIFFSKNVLSVEKKMTVKGLVHTELECVKNNLTTEEKVWSCCPKNWKPFNSHCYFFSTDSKSWNKSEESCSSMQAHLLVINTEEEQDFIIQNLKTDSSYYVGLSDPEGQRHWQWVDQTPYNENVTFWHPNEPNNKNERCVTIDYRLQWGWNDLFCDRTEKSVCEMMKIYL
ncbi:PREDICTED: C-type lectin domain family 4 member A-like [Chinchilla lanigera]|uniref:C-type lectin domain family 4 member A-like n=1 Tax=Chinchilla lanigera TaxID=34839 RepID=A0A8C2W132_CHILA|nr:PREDICTED: C-type lectin domain family 4 member A-like [Chinchilla lanigera]